MRKVVNQHGDVILYEVKEIPILSKNIEIKSGYILERGEGVHTHVFDDVSGIEVYEKDGKTYVKVKKDVFINHEEHGYQKIKPGKVEKGIERVFDYESMESRKVID